MKNLYFLFIALVTFGITNAQEFPVYDGTFGGATYKQTFVFPSGSQSWAGFANNNKATYPWDFPNGGKITFKASASAATSIKFKFERLPHPDVDPAFFTDEQAITTTETEYTVDIASQGTNTFSSALLYLIDNDIEVYLSEVKIEKYDTDGSTVIATNFPLYDGTFGGATYKQTFVFPAGSQSWAGFANNNKTMYPLSFPNGGEISFKASASAATSVKFKFERLPHPDVDPAFFTDEQAITTTETEYTIAFASQGTNTFSSALFYIIDNDIEVYLSEVKITATATQSIDDVSMSFSVYPNPAKNTLNISAATAIDAVSIFDLTGRRVLQATPKAASFSLNVADLNKGMYLVSLKVGDKEMTTKLVK
jgi:hypothetical protein